MINTGTFVRLGFGVLLLGGTASLGGCVTYAPTPSTPSSTTTTESTTTQPAVVAPSTTTTVQTNP